MKLEINLVKIPPPPHGFSTPLSIQSVSARLTQSQVSLKKAFPNRLIVREINRVSLAVFKGYLKFC